MGPIKARIWTSEKILDVFFLSLGSFYSFYSFSKNFYLFRRTFFSNCLKIKIAQSPSHFALFETKMLQFHSTHSQKTQGPQNFHTDFLLFFMIRPQNHRVSISGQAFIEVQFSFDISQISASLADLSFIRVLVNGVLAVERTIDKAKR